MMHAETVLVATAARAGRGRLLGGHLAHAIALGGFILATATVLVWPVQSDEVRRRRLEDDRAPTADRAWLQMAALGLFSAAAIHLAVTPAHFGQWWAYGVFFLGAASSQIAFGVLLLARPSRRVLVAGAAGSVAVVALWLASRLTGLPVGPDHGATEPFRVLDVLATVSEMATALCCVVALRLGAPRPAWRWAWWGLATRLVALLLSLGVPLTAAVSPRG
jgi:hypothetical protein